MFLDISKREKRKRTGPKPRVPADNLHAQFDQNIKSIIKNGMIVTPSESKVYKKIAQYFEQFGTNDQAVYQSAKRYFSSQIRSNMMKVKYKSGDYMSTYDKHKVGSQTNTNFVVNIEGMYLFRDSYYVRSRFQLGQTVFVKSFLRCREFLVLGR